MFVNMRCRVYSLYTALVAVALKLLLCDFTRQSLTKAPFDCTKRETNSAGGDRRRIGSPMSNVLTFDTKKCWSSLPVTDTADARRSLAHVDDNHACSVPASAYYAARSELIPAA